MFKVMLCAFLLVLLSPLFAVIGVLIVLTSGRPILFTQQRLGVHRIPFTIYKFRTMTNGHITRMGRFLRATGIDELPQLWNIAKNDMAFVGPRPLTQADVSRLGWLGTHYDVRWSVRPGITGLAQLSHGCHRKRTWCHDRYYAMQRSHCLDMKIIIRSAAVPFVGKNWGKRIWRLITNQGSK